MGAGRWESSAHFGWDRSAIKQTPSWKEEPPGQISPLSWQESPVREVLLQATVTLIREELLDGQYRLRPRPS